MVGQYIGWVAEFVFAAAPLAALAWATVLAWRIGR